MIARSRKPLGVASSNRKSSSISRVYKNAGSFFGRLGVRKFSKGFWSTTPCRVRYLKNERREAIFRAIVVRANPSPVTVGKVSPNLVNPHLLPGAELLFAHIFDKLLQVDAVI